MLRKQLYRATVAWLNGNKTTKAVKHYRFTAFVVVCKL